MSEMINENWQATKGALLEGLNGHKKSVMDVTLENTRRYLAEWQLLVQLPQEMLQH